MSINKRARLTGKGRETNSFAGVPRKVMNSSDFRSLSSSSIRVLLWLAYQYRGKNNGDLSATHTMAAGWGIKAKDTLAKALRELIDKGFIHKTRHGRFMRPGHCCDLYALSWAAVDDCMGKNLEVRSTRAPLRIHW